MRDDEAKVEDHLRQRVYELRNRVQWLETKLYNAEWALEHQDLELQAMRSGYSPALDEYLNGG